MATTKSAPGNKLSLRPKSVSIFFFISTTQWSKWRGKHYGGGVGGANLFLGALLLVPMKRGVNVFESLFVFRLIIRTRARLPESSYGEPGVWVAFRSFF